MKVLPPIANPPMQAGQGQRELVPPVRPLLRTGVCLAPAPQGTQRPAQRLWRFDDRAIRHDGEVLKAQVDADHGAATGLGVGTLHLDLKRHVPSVRPAPYRRRQHPATKPGRRLLGSHPADARQSDPRWPTRTPPGRRNLSSWPFLRKRTGPIAAPLGLPVLEAKKLSKARRRSRSAFCPQHFDTSYAHGAFRALKRLHILCSSGALGTLSPLPIMPLARRSPQWKANLAVAAARAGRFAWRVVGVGS